MVSSPDKNHIYNSESQEWIGSPSFSFMHMTPYDIVIIGSGIASSMTLCQLAERLKEQKAEKFKLRIGIVEKADEFVTGIPYGRRSIIGALAFQKLQDFLDEPERSSYIEWLMANKGDWLEFFRESGGLGAARWIADNQIHMELGRWEELYLPRFLFGRYVSSLVQHAINELSNNGLATVTFHHGEATDISRRRGGSYAIVVEDGETRTLLNSGKVVLAIGSPPQKCVYNPAYVAKSAHTHVEDLYSPSEAINVTRIYQALSSLPERRMANILIVGSNASSLEVLYLINNRPEIRNLVNSVVILSRSGMLPYKVCEETIAYEFMALEALREAGSFSADDLIRAITADIRRAEDLKINIADLRNAVGDLYGQLVSLMHISEQERFVCRHGLSFSKMMRRAGRDTRNAADELVHLQILTMVKGELCALKPSPSHDDLALASYLSASGNEEVIYPVPFSITINCGGFEELDVCSARLINSLINNNLCQVNSSNRGFLVNERLEADENLYVIGPLVGGNFNSKVRFWHVESAARIAGLSKLLADSLFESFFSAPSYSYSEVSISPEVLPAGAPHL